MGRTRLERELESVNKWIQVQEREVLAGNKEYSYDTAKQRKMFLITKKIRKMAMRCANIHSAVRKLEREVEDSWKLR